MRIVKNELCPRCKKETLDVFTHVGSQIVGESKKCSNCGYSEIPDSTKTLGELAIDRNTELDSNNRLSPDELKVE